MRLDEFNGGNMKEKERYILKLADLGFSYDEISKATGVKKGTVSSTLSRVRVCHSKLKEIEGRVKGFFEMPVMTHKDFGLAKAAGIRSRYKDSQNY